MTSTTRPDGKSIGEGYDKDGDTTAVTPPGKPAHGFAYTPIEQLASYTPPDVGSGATATAWAYDLDGQLATITRPDGLVVSYGYDPAGRVSGVTLPAAQGAVGRFRKCMRLCMQSAGCSL